MGDVLFMLVEDCDGRASSRRKAAHGEPLGPLQLSIHLERVPEHLCVEILIL